MTTVSDLMGLGVPALYAQAMANKLSAVAYRPGAQHFAALGDSITANGGIPPGGYRTQAPQGFTTWLSALSKQRIILEPSDNFGISGQTSTQIAARVGSVLQVAPDWCVVEAGTNDAGNGVTGDVTIANLQAIYTALLGAGIHIVAIPITPRVSQSTSTNQQFARVNNFIRRFAQQNAGVVVADPRFNGFANLTSGDPATGLTSDGLHPNPAGAKLFAQTILNALGNFVTLTDSWPLLTDLNDTYDASFNPTGTMLANGFFVTQSGGTIASTPAGVLTGAAPAGWGLSFSGKAGATYTGTLALSYQSRTDQIPGSLLRIAATSLAGGNAQDKFQVYQQLNFPAGLSPGDVIEAHCLMNVNATSGQNGFDVDLTVSMGDGNGANNAFATGMGPYTAAAGWPQGSYSVVLKTPRYTIPAALDVQQRIVGGFVNVYFDTTSAATATVDIGPISLRKVI